MKKPSKNNPRLTAVLTLGNVLDKSLNLGDADASGKLPDPRDRALSRHLSYGVLRWLSSLQWMSSKLLSKPLKARDADINRLIWIGLFQLWKDDSAPHAAINETAECARSLGKPWAVGLVNAVLRRFQREQSQVTALLAEVPERFGFPPWLLQQLKEDWPEDWPEIIDESNLAAPLWLRVNRGHSQQDGIGQQLETAGFTTATHPSAPDAISISPTAAVDDIPGFRDGALSVQDPAAQLAVDLLSLEPGLRVLDACAAPGGKTCHILEREPSTELMAVELYEPRLQRIRENLQRLDLNDLKGLKLVAADAAEPTAWWDQQAFDRILLDAPCTATGVIRRHPEIKWLRSTRQLDEVVQVQSRLLNQLWPLLKPGGILVYATCSVLRQENNHQINQFLTTHGDAEAIPMDDTWGRKLDTGRQILPGEGGMDGFFYARLRKIS